MPTEEIGEKEVTRERTLEPGGSSSDIETIDTVSLSGESEVQSEPESAQKERPGFELRDKVEVKVEPQKRLQLRSPIRISTNGRVTFQNPRIWKYFERNPEDSFLHRLVSKPKEIANTLINRLKSIDGIDETAASMAQIRGLTGPIAAETVFVGGFPFVIFGLIGMMQESQAAREAFHQLAKDKNSTIDQLNNLVKTHLQDQRPESVANQDVTKDKRLVKDAKKLYRNLFKSYGNLPTKKQKEQLRDCCELFAQLKGIDKQTAETMYDRIAAPFGELALGGMTAGMVTGMTWGGAEIAARAMGQTVPETAKALSGAPAAAATASVAGFATSAVFAPANASMAVYAASRAMAGKKRHDRLVESQKRIDSWVSSSESQLSSNESQAVNIAKQYRERQKELNRWSSTGYGIVTSISQGGLSASGALTIAAFAGASVGSFGSFIAIPGAVGAIGAAAARIRTDNRSDIFSGDESLVPSSERISYNRIYEGLREQFPENSNALATAALKKTCAKVYEASECLAKQKVYSLAIHAIESSPDASKRQGLVDKWIANQGKRGTWWGKGTSLLHETAKSLKGHNHSGGVASAFAKSDKGEAMHVLAQQAGYGNARGILERLQQFGLLEKFSQEFAVSTLRSQEPTERLNLRASEKCASMIFRNYEKGKSPDQRMKALDRELKLFKRGLGTRLPKDTRSEVVTMLADKRDEIASVMGAANEQDFAQRLENVLSASPTLPLVKRLKSRHSKSTNKIEPYDYKGDDNPFGWRSQKRPTSKDQCDAKSDSSITNDVNLFHYDEQHKNHYHLDTSQLIDRLDKTDRNLEKNFYRVAMPLLIEAEKNAAKVVLNDAVSCLDQATIHANEIKLADSAQKQEKLASKKEERPRSFAARFQHARVSSVDMSVRV